MLQVFLKSLLWVILLWLITKLKHDSGVSLIKINVAGYLMGSGLNFG